MDNIYQSVLFYLLLTCEFTRDHVPSVGIMACHYLWRSQFHVYSVIWQYLHTVRGTFWNVMSLKQVPGCLRFSALLRGETSSVLVGNCQIIRLHSLRVTTSTFHIDQSTTACYCRGLQRCVRAWSIHKVEWRQHWVCRKACADEIQTQTT